MAHRYVVKKNHLGLDIKLIEPGGDVRNVTLFYKSFTSPVTNIVAMRLSISAPPAGESIASDKWNNAIEQLACKFADMLYTELYGDDDVCDSVDCDTVASVHGSA